MFYRVSYTAVYWIKKGIASKISNIKTINRLLKNQYPSLLGYQRMTEPFYTWNGREYVTKNNVPIVWVDGSCLDNGRPNARSGIGCWADDDDCWS